MKKLIKSFAIVAILGVVAFGSTSCNKGYGCPTEFSVDAADIVTPVVAVVINQVK